MNFHKYQICKECNGYTTHRLCLMTRVFVTLQKLQKHNKPNWITDEQGQLQLEKITRQVKRAGKIVNLIVSLVLVVE